MDLISKLPSNTETLFKQNFQSLKIVNFKQAFIDSDADDKAIRFLKECPLLTHLTLDECKITDETIIFISKFLNHLEYLSCVGCKQITLTHFTQALPSTIAQSVASTALSVPTSRDDNEAMDDIVGILTSMNVLKKTRSERRNDAVVAKYQEASLRYKFSLSSCCSSDRFFLIFIRICLCCCIL
jgi:hypothetical protein